MSDKNIIVNKNNDKINRCNSQKTGGYYIMKTNTNRNERKR